MKHHIRWTVGYGALLCTLSVGLTGSDAATQADQADPVVPASSVTTRSVKAVGYQVGGGSTKIDMKGTELMTQAYGEAKVEIKNQSRKDESRRYPEGDDTTLAVGRRISYLCPVDGYTRGEDRQYRRDSHQQDKVLVNPCRSLTMTVPQAGKKPPGGNRRVRRSHWREDRDVKESSRRSKSLEV